jgi:hypothetical protein
MSRYAVRALLAAALLLSLCACDILFMGRFSSDLGQATARADLSGGVSAYDAPSFTLSLVAYGDTEYVLLYSSTDFDPAAAHLYVLSRDLKVLNAYTLEDIAALDPVGVAFSGSAAMTHLAEKRIIIGNVAAMPADKGLALTGKLATPAYGTDAVLEGWAIEGPAAADYTWTGFKSDWSTLSYRAYAAGWGGVTTMSCPLGMNAWFRGAFTDPTSAESNTIILAFSVDSEDENACYFLPVAKTPDLENGFSGYDLLTDYDSILKYDLDGNSIAAVKSGIVAYSESSKAWTWFTLTDPGNEKKLPVRYWDSDALRTAFSFANGWYCVWDSGARTLTRYEKWW